MRISQVTTAFHGFPPPTLVKSWLHQHWWCAFFHSTNGSFRNTVRFDSSADPNTNWLTPANYRCFFVFGSALGGRNRQRHVHCFLCSLVLARNTLEPLRGYVLNTHWTSLFQSRFVLKEFCDLRSSCSQISMLQESCLFESARFLLLSALVIFYACISPNSEFLEHEWTDCVFRQVCFKTFSLKCAWVEILLLVYRIHNSSWCIIRWTWCAFWQFFDEGLKPVG